MTELPQTIPGLLARAASRWPDRAALVDHDVHLTWAELYRKVGGAAAGLRRTGVAPGEVVGLWAPNSARWVVAALAVLEAGAVVAPLSSRLRGYEVLEMLTEVGAETLVLQTDFLGRDYVDLLLAATRSTGLDLPRLVHLDDRPSQAMQRLPDPGVGWAELIDPAPPGETAVGAPSDDDPADILFTSGTTGRSRGVRMSHAQVSAMAATWVERAGLTAEDRYLILSPMSHTFGYKTGLVACLVAGATMIPAAVADPEAVVTLLRHSGATVLPGVPAALHALITSPALPSPDELDVRLVVTGGAPSTPAEIRELAVALGAERVISAYGLTEAGPVTMTEHDTPLDRVATTVGSALPEVEVQIRATAGEPGEVLVRSPFVGSGPAIELEDGWLATGDVGFVDEAGHLRIVDRIKDVLQTGGFSVYPAEVERVLGEVPGVEAASVVGVPDDRLGEVGAAFVVVAGRSVAPDKLIAHCRDRLAGYKVPREVYVVPELPRNSTGKVLKGDLREHALARRTPAASS